MSDSVLPGSSLPWQGRSENMWRPNMRVKLSGALVGRIAFPPWRAFLSAAPPPCANGRCARSLSAIR